MGHNRQQPWAAGLLSLMLDGLTGEMAAASRLELHVQPVKQQGYDTPLIPVLILWWLAPDSNGLVGWYLDPFNQSHIISYLTNKRLIDFSVMSSETIKDKLHKAKISYVGSV